MDIAERCLPKSVIALRNYSARDFGADALAGLTFEFVALRRRWRSASLRGGLASRDSYRRRAGFLISAPGGSRVQIGGPTGAFVVIVAGIVANFGIAGLTLVTVMAGGMLVLMGVTGRLGRR